MQNQSGAGRSSRRWVLWLLIIPFIGTLWVPFYASANPTWNGIPFFYWYQFAAVIVTAILTAIVYFIVG
jgi:uncharacterized membrane protein YhdT